MENLMMLGGMLGFLLLTVFLAGTAIGAYVLVFGNMAKKKKSCENGESVKASVSSGKTWLLILIMTALTIYAVTLFFSKHLTMADILGASALTAIGVSGAALGILHIIICHSMTFTVDGVYLGARMIPCDKCTYKVMRVDDSTSIFTLFTDKKSGKKFEPESNAEMLSFLSRHYTKADGKTRPAVGNKLLLSPVFGAIFTAASFAVYMIAKPVVFAGWQVLDKNWQNVYFSWNWVAPAGDSDDLGYGLTYTDEKTVLSVNNMKANDMYSLKYLPNLTKLSVMDNKIEHLKFLYDLPNLEYFYMGYGKNEVMPDFSPLASLKKLTDFSFNNIGVKDFDGFKYLAELPDLQYLRLEDVRVSAEDMADILKMKSVKMLALPGSEIETIKGIGDLDGLIDLDLKDCVIGDPECIKECKNVEVLDVTRTDFGDYSFLGEMDSVKELYIVGVRADDYSFLYDMKGLKAVYVSNSKPDELDEVVDNLGITVFEED